jgi:hypothetical protein
MKRCAWVEPVLVTQVKFTDRRLPQPEAHGDRYFMGGFLVLETVGVALYLNRRLRSEGIHDLNAVNYCT